MVAATCEVEEQSAAVDANRLRNWGRWCRVWDAQGCAQSLEGNFRAARDEEEKYGITRSKPIPPDVRDAWAVECAMRYLPFKYHLLLKLRHVGRCNERLICRVMRIARCGRIAVHDLPAAEGMAAALLSAALELPAVVRNEHIRRRVRVALHLVR